MEDLDKLSYEQFLEEELDKGMTHVRLNIPVSSPEYDVAQSNLSKLYEERESLKPQEKDPWYVGLGRGVATFGKELMKPQTLIAIGAGVVSYLTYRETKAQHIREDEYRREQLDVAKSLGYEALGAHEELRLTDNQVFNQSQKILYK